MRKHGLPYCTYISCGLVATCKRALRNISRVAQTFDLRKLLPNGCDQKSLVSKGEDACMDVKGSFFGGHNWVIWHEQPPPVCLLIRWRVLSYQLYGRFNCQPPIRKYAARKTEYLASPLDMVGETTVFCDMSF